MRKVTWMVPVGLLLASVAVPVSGFGQQGADPAEQYYDCIRLNEMRMLNAMVNTKGVKIKDKHAATPLHYAAAYGSLEALRAILSAGPDVNAQNDFGATPLMWAITEPEKVRLLVAAGADVNAKSKMGRTALYLAAANDGSAATVRLLLDHGAKVEPDALVAAAFANDLASIRLLLERGAPIEREGPPWPDSADARGGKRQSEGGGTPAGQRRRRERGQPGEIGNGKERRHRAGQSHRAHAGGFRPAVPK